ncbi:hypothetical protein Y1Q_0009595 [Alligator mississippiensis]|uniref:Uncharacterized protein n=1 Tax=Alligator mississippiensis TaxID=8496 RepID=A0A151NVG9_ALLMI|nr:hypothetical protein Y1Q_0009595 [Alligator mississippiensis]
MVTLNDRIQPSSRLGPAAATRFPPLSRTPRRVRGSSVVDDGGSRTQRLASPLEDFKIFSERQMAQRQAQLESSQVHNTAATC